MAVATEDTRVEVRAAGLGTGAGEGDDIGSGPGVLPAASEVAVGIYGTTTAVAVARTSVAEDISGVTLSEPHAMTIAKNTGSRTWAGDRAVLMNQTLQWRQATGDSRKRKKAPQKRRGSVKSRQI